MREITNPLYSKVSDLEGDICKLQVLGDLLMSIGTPRVGVSPELVHVVGQYVHDTAASLKEDWNALRLEMGDQS